MYSTPNVTHHLTKLGISPAICKCEHEIQIHFRSYIAKLCQTAQERDGLFIYAVICRTLVGGDTPVALLLVASDEGDRCDAHAE